MAKGLEYNKAPTRMKVLINLLLLTAPFQKTKGNITSDKMLRILMFLN